MPTNKRYSKEGVLNANKTVTKLVTQWLSKNKFTKDDWMKQNFTAVIRYINLNLKVGNTVHNLASQYGSFETYLSYLIKDIEPGVMKENKGMKLANIAKIILKESVPAPRIGSMISVYHPDRGAVEMKVIDRHKNIITCEYENIEYTVRLGKIHTGTGKIEYRWEAEKL